jgi:Leucine-rich repeat (LRR) protein
MGKDSEIYSMKHLCYTNQNEYKIFIISGCMMLNVNKPEIQENILDIKKIKYFNTKINIDVEKEYFTKDDPPTNSYQYYCVTHQNYIFNYKFYSAKNLISFYETQPEEIEIYDNRNRIVNEIIQKLNSAVPIPEKYIHFLQSLSFKELQLTILNLLTHLSSAHLSSAHSSIYLQTQILDRVFIKDYIERKIGVFQRYIYNFETKNYDPDIEKRALTYIKGKINDILLLESFFKNQESIDYHAKFHQMMAESLEFPEVYFIETILKGSIISPEKYKSMFFKRPVFDDFAYLEFPKYTGLQQITFKQSHLNGDVNRIVITSFNYTLIFQNCILESGIDFQNFYSCENLEFNSVQIKDSTFMINNKFPFLKNFKFCDVKEGGLSHIIFHEQIKLQLIMIKDSDIRIIQIISNLPALQKLHLINLPNLKLFFNSSHLSNLQILHLQQIKIPDSDIKKLLNLPKLQRVILYSVSINSEFTYELLQSQVKFITIRDTPIILDLTKVNREFEIETIQTDDSVTLKTLYEPWFSEKITFESL